jgi:hypothetical protein
MAEKARLVNKGGHPIPPESLMPTTLFLEPKRRDSCYTTQNVGT